MIERITPGNVDEVFRYHTWDEDQKERGVRVSEAIKAAAVALLDNVPDSPQRTQALNTLVMARMLANAAITFESLST